MCIQVRLGCTYVAEAGAGAAETAEARATVSRVEEGLEGKRLWCNSLGNKVAVVLANSRSGGSVSGTKQGKWYLGSFRQ